MSVKLEQAIAKRQVLVRKLVSGEAVIHFHDKNIKDIILSHGTVMDILARRGVTVDAIRKSNLKELIESRVVDVL